MAFDKLPIIALPDTNAVNVSHAAVAWAITQIAYSDESFTFTKPEERATLLANTYLRVYKSLHEDRFIQAEGEE